MFRNKNSKMYFLCSWCHLFKKKGWFRGIGADSGYSETLHEFRTKPRTAVTLIISVAGQTFICCRTLLLAVNLTACSTMEVSALLALVRCRIVPSTLSPLLSFCLQDNSVMWPLMTGKLWERRTYKKWQIRRWPLYKKISYCIKTLWSLGLSTAVWDLDHFYHPCQGANRRLQTS